MSKKVELFLEEAVGQGVYMRDKDEPGYIHDVAEAVLFLLRHKTVEEAKNPENFQSEKLDETQNYRRPGLEYDTWYEPLNEHPLFHFVVGPDIDPYELMSIINDGVDDLDTDDCCGLTIRLAIGFSLETDFGAKPKGTDFRKAEGMRTISFNVEWEQE